MAINMCGLFRISDMKELGMHCLDIAVLAGIVAIDVALNLAVEPNERFVGETMLEYLMYPVKDDTVPFWTVPILVLGLPLIVFAVDSLILKRNLKKLYNSVIGLLFAVALTSCITDALKNAIGQPRPDFYWRCFPDGNGVFNTTTGEVICNGVTSTIQEGHKSFPSGHTAWSFSGLGFLSIYLAHRLLHFGSKRGHGATLLVVLAPLLMAVAVSATRVMDYMHRFTDVLGGALLGLFIATLTYYQYLSEDDEAVADHTSISEPLMFDDQLQASRTSSSTLSTHNEINVQV